MKVKNDSTFEERAKDSAAKILRKMQEYIVELQRDIVSTLEIALRDYGLVAEDILFYTENNELCVDHDQDITIQQ